jgi:hypothetical protein
MTNLVVNVQRDDGIIVYLNGHGIFTNNMPEGSVNYLTPSTVTVGGEDETTFYSQAIDRSLLVNGNNVLAAEVHQVNGTSSDIIFDLELTGEAFAMNLPPQASAGPDQTVQFPAQALLSGSVSDDGLPTPPGLLTFGWSKVSGPGDVTFANSSSMTTTVAFSAQGSYVLRLSASDGASSVSDDVIVTTTGASQPSVHIDAVEYVSGATPMVKLTLTIDGPLTCTVQYRDSLADGQWSKLTDLQPGNAATLGVLDMNPSSSARYYRVVSPAQP